jgi:hypothetical protein
VPDEPSARRAEFAPGATVVLADGQGWSLPLRDAARDDPEYDALLDAVAEAEDTAERLRAELALTIFLLDRNYALNPDEIRALLTFRPGDPRLSEAQAAVHALALESLRRRPRRG